MNEWWSWPLVITLTAIALYWLYQLVNGIDNLVHPHKKRNQAQAKARKAKFEAMKAESLEKEIQQVKTKLDSVELSNYYAEGTEGFIEEAEDFASQTLEVLNRALKVYNVDDNSHSAETYEVIEQAFQQASALVKQVEENLTHARGIISEHGEERSSTAA